MEYYFEWVTHDADWRVTGRYSQNIYGKSLAEACEYFESFHGEVGEDVDCNILEITCVREVM